MKRNESTLDRIIRVVLGLALLALSFVTAGALRIMLIAAAAIALFTALTGFCLLYRLFGIKTCKE